MASSHGPLSVRAGGLFEIEALAAQPGLVHGFSTRALGSMAAVPGQPVRTANRRALAAALGLDPDRLTVAGAVHGTRVAKVASPAELVEGADALLTDRPGIPLLVTCADCYAVVLFDPRRRVLGLVHAGWRGTAAGVARLAVEEMAAAFGCWPPDLVAGLGPGICGRCYQVSPEVAARFDRRFSRLSPDGGVLLDLGAANRQQLEAAGMDPARIFAHGACTLETPELPSHRRCPDGSRFACVAAIR